MLMLMLLLVTFSDVLYFGPQRDQYYQLQNQLNDLRAQLMSLKSLNDPGNNLESLNHNVAQINSKLIFAADSLKLSKLMLELSKQHGVQIIRQSNSEDTSASGLILKQSLSVEGSYRQIRGFIDGIYRLPSMTIIQQLRLQKKSGNKKLLTGSLLLLTYQNGMSRQ